MNKELKEAFPIKQESREATNLKQETEEISKPGNSDSNKEHSNTKYPSDKESVQNKDQHEQKQSERSFSQVRTAAARHESYVDTNLLDVPPISTSSLIKHKIRLGQIPYLGPDLAHPENSTDSDFDNFFGNTSTKETTAEKQEGHWNPNNSLQRSVTVPSSPKQQIIPAPVRTPSSPASSFARSPSPKSLLNNSTPRTPHSPARPLPTPSSQSQSPSPTKPYNTLSKVPSHIYSPNSQRRPSNSISNASPKEIKTHRSPLPSIPQMIPKIHTPKQSLSNNFSSPRSPAFSRNASVSSNTSFMSAISSPSSNQEPSIMNVKVAQPPKPKSKAFDTFHSAFLPPTPADAELNAEHTHVSCSVCQKSIYSNERVVQTSAMTTLHLSCFRCSKCHMSLEHSQFYVHDTASPKQGLLPSPPSLDNHGHEGGRGIDNGNIGGNQMHNASSRKEQSSKPTKFLYCHLDYHELFSPRCNYCSTPIEGSTIFALDKHWHEGHFFCGSCNKPFEKGQDYCVVDPTQALKEGKIVGIKGSTHAKNNTGTANNNTVAWCTSCFSKKTSLSCWKCSKTLPQHNSHNSSHGTYSSSHAQDDPHTSEPCIEALGRTWCTTCFACEECDVPFDTSEFILREDGTLVCFACEAKRIRMDVWK